jgi:3-hydroxyisobutyrate dehydrogenase-like beta-hydroxyacid dehydrogenase
VSTPADTAQNRAASNADSTIRRIGVIGLGHMGSDFADNLIADGYQVTVYDLNEKHIAALVAKGATGAARLRDIAGCEAVLTSLPDDHALTEVTLGDGGLIHMLTPGAIHISMSTVSPGLSRRLAQTARTCRSGLCGCSRAW